MNFSSHLIKFQEETKEALLMDKEGLLLKLKNVIIGVSELIQTNEYDFWLNQLNEMPFQEFPVTKNGIIREKVRLEEKMNQKSIPRGMIVDLERLFTFWEEDDLCEMQGQFFYYKSKASNQIFSESEFGSTRGLRALGVSDVSIATITDLRSAEIISHRNEDQLLR